jgi:hypothetical protein
MANILQLLNISTKGRTEVIVLYDALWFHFRLNGRTVGGKVTVKETYAGYASRMGFKSIQRARRALNAALKHGWVTAIRDPSPRGVSLQVAPTRKLFDLVPGVFSEADQNQYWSGDIPWNQETGGPAA